MLKKLQGIPLTNARALVALFSSTFKVVAYFAIYFIRRFGSRPLYSDSKSRLAGLKKTERIINMFVELHVQEL